METMADETALLFEGICMQLRSTRVAHIIDYGYKARQIDIRREKDLVGNDGPFRLAQLNNMNHKCWPNNKYRCG